MFKKFNEIKTGDILYCICYKYPNNGFGTYMYKVKEYIISEGFLNLIFDNKSYNDEYSKIYIPINKIKASKIKLSDNEYYFTNKSEYIEFTKTILKTIE
jgi:hypothetical protein